MAKICYTILTVFLLSFSLSAQNTPTISTELLLRNEVLFLKRALAEERGKINDAAVAFAQCQKDGFERSKVIFDNQIDGAYKEWLLDVETAYPGWTWDGKTLVKKEQKEQK